MKSIYDIFKNEDPTAEGIQRMLATCDDTSEYIKDNMIYCRKCNEPRREWLSLIGGYVPVMCSCMIAEQNKHDRLARIENTGTQAFLTENFRNANLISMIRSQRRLATCAEIMREGLTSSRKQEKGLFCLEELEQARRFLHHALRMN